MACHVMSSKFVWSPFKIYHGAIHQQSCWLLSEETMVSLKETINLDIYIETWFPVGQVANTFQQEIQTNVSMDTAMLIKKCTASKQNDVPITTLDICHMSIDVDLTNCIHDQDYFTQLVDF